MEEDRVYLTNKGVFSLPGEEACNSLLQAYFRHVHPIMPVIEVDHILHFFHIGRLREYNLLLVWSVFFVAVNVRLNGESDVTTIANLSVCSIQYL